MNEITIGDKLYISSKRAAEITGYAKDYVGQLCREGHVDAKMVGRSWYVYEPSIRAHRFGVEAESLEEVSDDAEESVSTWEKPTYTSELPQELPELQVPAYVETAAPTEQTLTDMQAAWREWFERKQEVLETPELESPEVLESRYEAREELDEREEGLGDEEEQGDESEDEAPTGGNSRDWRVEAEENSEYEEETEEETQVPLHRIEEEVPYIPAQEPARAQVSPEMPVTAPVHAIPTSTPVWPTHEPVRAPSFGMHDVMQPQAVAGIRPIEYATATPERNEGRVIEEKILRKQARPESARGVSKGNISSAKGSTAHLPAIALLIAMSLLSIAIAAIGSGFASKHFKTTVLDNTIIDFLVGDREFKR